MKRRELIRHLVYIVRGINDDKVLKDIVNLASVVYNHYKIGNWN